MSQPRIIILYGKQEDFAVQRAVASELSDRLARSLVLGFATPLREAYRATFDVPRSSLLSAYEAEKVADWCNAFRGFLREWSGKDVLGNLAIQNVASEWYSHPFFIIEDGSDTYIDDLKVLTKKFRREILLVNFNDVRPLRSNSLAICSIADQSDPEDIAAFIEAAIKEEEPTAHA